MRFSMMGFPVQVDWTFFLVALFLGARRGDAILWLIWVAVVFVSVLIHELGHALAGRRFGLRARIQLYSMGGVTSWSGERRLTNVESILVSLAGPGAGLLTGAIVYAIAREAGVLNPYLYVMVQDLLWVNIGWSLVNLLPILPLDGGHVMRSTIHLVKGRPDEVTALRISIAVGVVAGLLAFSRGLLFAAILAGFITYTNFTTMQRLRGHGI